MADCPHEYGKQVASLEDLIVGDLLIIGDAKWVHVGDLRFARSFEFRVFTPDELRELIRVGFVWRFFEFRIAFKVNSEHLERILGILRDSDIGFSADVYILETDNPGKLTETAGGSEEDGNV